MAVFIILGYRGHTVQGMSRRRRGHTSPTLFIPAVLAVVLGAASTAARAADAVPEERVPLDANFSVAERATTVAVAATGILSLSIAPYWTTPEAPSLGAPEPGSYDRRISDWLYLSHGTDDRFLWRVPDYAGIAVLPYLPAVYYGVQTAWLQRTGQPLFAGGGPNPDHHLWAYVEAIGWTALISGVTKVIVGRPRPYLVLDHPELAGRSSEANLSFYSAHAAATFCAASFVALDVSDWLRREPLRRAGTAKRLLLGVVAPYAATYSVAGLVGVSRIIDQQHWFSDVFMGAVLGAGAAHLAYIVHFDTLGRPRRRLGEDALGAPGAYGLGPIPGGIAFRGLLP